MGKREAQATGRGVNLAARLEKGPASHGSPLSPAEGRAGYREQRAPFSPRCKTSLCRQHSPSSLGRCSGARPRGQGTLTPCTGHSSSSHKLHGIIF